MVPHNQTFGRVRDEGIRPGHRAALTVIHAISTLPGRLDGALENGGGVEIGIKETALVAAARLTIWNLCRVIGRPPNLVRPRRRRVVRAGTGWHTGGAAVRVGWRVRAISEERRVGKECRY